MKKLFLIFVLFLVAGTKAEDSKDLELMQQFTDALDYGRFDKFEAIYKQNPEWIVKNKQELIRKINLQFETTNSLEKDASDRLHAKHIHENVPLIMTIIMLLGTGIYSTIGAMTVGIGDHFKAHGRIPIYKNKFAIGMTITGIASFTAGIGLIKWSESQKLSEEEKAIIERKKTAIISLLILIQNKKLTLNKILTLIDSTDSVENKKDYI